MILGGLALAFSRIIDNSVISLENIYRHLEEGASPVAAAEVGGNEVNFAVLAATLTTVVVFFPVTFLYGVSKFLFSALALAVVISLFASYLVAMTVIPLFCSRFLKAVPHAATRRSEEYEVEPEIAESGSKWDRFTAAFNRQFNKLLDFYEYWVKRAVARPWLTVAALSGAFVLSLAIYPLLGLAFFPRTDAGQFTINLKVPTGTRLEVTEQYVAKVEDLIRREIGSKDVKIVVSNIGVMPDFSALYTTNAGPYMATIQVALEDEHKKSSFEYMDRVQKAIAEQFPEIRTFLSSGSMVDAILNSGMQAPIDIQVSGRSLHQTYNFAQQSGDEDTPATRRRGGLHSAGSELSRSSPGCRSRSRGGIGPHAEGSGRQRDHRAEFECHDRSQLLGGSQDRKRLFPHRAISRARLRGHP